MQNYITAGLSLPKDILLKIDKERGDIPRSKYILRILQRMFANAGTPVDKVTGKDSGHQKLDSKKVQQEKV
jgi:hypothetical protein